MKGGFRQSMAWLHTWSGLLVGWVLFAVFLTGTVSYFRAEISFWMRPELHAARVAPDAAENVLRRMHALAPSSSSWIINLPSERDPLARVFWRDPSAGGNRFRRAILDPATGEDLPARETLGGDFFYTFHYQFHHMPVLWGRWIISVCAMFMLVAILSGIVTHRRIFADFFTFRPRKGQRSWLDGHAVTAVLALPYHLMITYTGIVTLMLMTMPWGVQVAFKGDNQAFSATVFGLERPSPRSGQAAPLAPVMPMLDAASRHWGGAQPGRITVNNPGDVTSTVQVFRVDDDRLSVNRQVVSFNGVTGAMVSASGGNRPAAETRGVMVGLHRGVFGGGAMRALFFLSGLMGTVMVATGIILWAVKQRQKLGARAGAGTRLVEVLNVAAIGGLPIAMTSYLWANRLLPVEMAQRSAWEVHVFFIAWGIAAMHPLLRTHRRAWVEQLGLGAALLLLLPALNAVTTHSHLGITLPAGQWALAGLDLLALGFGAALAFAAWHVGQPVAEKRHARHPARQVNPVPAE
ncbi:PepSY-associated TM helix domain-containing protein [Sabulicella rubraurantiaca]|uniref:PepSY-associated TM helix domain-containing protein n=1 Tax=Sabulicella rubraurantiaca TaxID=2811429 RepID=UPI001A95D1CA|nr:PepSY-associated TM helix domain-containing protein [Sabulicella rubraurantiaca]